MATEIARRRSPKNYVPRESCGLVIAGGDADRDPALRLLGAVELVLVGAGAEGLAPIVALNGEFCGLQRLERHRDERDIAAATALRAGARLGTGGVERSLGRQRFGPPGRREDRRIDPEPLLRPPANDDRVRILALAIGLDARRDVAKRLRYDLGMGSSRVLPVRSRAGQSREEQHAKAVSQATSRNCRSDELRATTVGHPS